MNLVIGNIGHLSVIVAFAAALVAAYGYVQATRGRALGDNDASWLRIARAAFSPAKKWSCRVITSCNTSRPKVAPSRKTITDINIKGRYV